MKKGKLYVMGQPGWNVSILKSIELLSLAGE